MWEGIFNELGPEFQKTIDDYMEGCVLRLLKGLGQIPVDSNITVQEMWSNPTYKAKRLEYGYRWLRPEDQILGGTEYVYYQAYADGTTFQRVINHTSPTRIPTGQAIAHLGFYCGANLGIAGMLRVDLNNQKKIEIPANIVYDMKYHTLVPLKSSMFFSLNDQVSWNLLQNTGVAITAIVWPIAHVIAPLAQIGLN